MLKNFRLRRAILHLQNTYFPLQNRYFRIPKCQNFPPAAGYSPLLNLLFGPQMTKISACGGPLFYRFTRGNGPPQAENFAILDLSNGDF